MKVIETRLSGVLIVEPRVFADERGHFVETWREDRYAGLGIGASFVQDNVSFSRYSVLRGLHYQHPHPQGKLITVLQGSVFDVVVDIRMGSATFGQWLGAELSDENRRQMFIPEGFAHGFLVTSETAVFHYKCTDLYRPESEGSIRWDDPSLGIDWPITDPILSAKDAQAPTIAEIPEERLPRWSTHEVLPTLRDATPRGR
ncbi:MAG: dTDP-4-dehydrorhamnose 3,5-epimerase [Longimicrobiaceae bacterium]